MERHAPLVAQRIKESVLRDWGWPSQKLADIDPDAVIIHSVQCCHGEGHKGWLVATLERMWWLEKGLLRSAEQPLGYDWEIEVHERGRLAPRSPVGISSRRGVLCVGADYFQMHAEEVDDFARFVRQMQQALSRPM